MSDGSEIDVLVVAAFMPELEGLRPLLGGSFRSRIGSTWVAAVAVGIGLCESAAGMTTALSRYRPRTVIQIGTCGVYRRAASLLRPSPDQSHAASGEAGREPGEARGVADGAYGEAGREPGEASGCDRSSLAIGQIVVARQIHLVSVAAVLGRGLVPSPVLQLACTDAPLTAGLARDDAFGAAVATTLAITTDDHLAAHIAHLTGCDVEHLESFAVQRACALQGVPFASVLGIANEVGAEAHAQWLAHHRDAGSRAAERVCEWLESGASGVPRR